MARLNKPVSGLQDALGLYQLGSFPLDVPPFLNLTFDAGVYVNQPEVVAHDLASTAGPKTHWITTLPDDQDIVLYHLGMGTQTLVAGDAIQFMIPVIGTPEQSNPTGLAMTFNVIADDLYNTVGGDVQKGVAFPGGLHLPAGTDIGWKYVVATATNLTVTASAIFTSHSP